MWVALVSPAILSVVAFISEEPIEDLLFPYVGSTRDVHNNLAFSHNKQSVASTEGSRMVKVMACGMRVVHHDMLLADDDGVLYCGKRIRTVSDDMKPGVLSLRHDQPSLWRLVASLPVCVEPEPDKRELSMRSVGCKGNN